MAFWSWLFCCCPLSASFPSLPQSPPDASPPLGALGALLPPPPPPVVPALSIPIPSCSNLLFVLLLPVSVWMGAGASAVVGPSCAPPSLAAPPLGSSPAPGWGEGGDMAVGAGHTPMQTLMGLSFVSWNRVLINMSHCLLVVPRLPTLSTTGSPFSSLTCPPRPSLLPTSMVCSPLQVVPSPPPPPPHFCLPPTFMLPSLFPLFPSSPLSLPPLSLLVLLTAPPPPPAPPPSPPSAPLPPFLRSLLLLFLLLWCVDGVGCSRPTSSPLALFLPPSPSPSPHSPAPPPSPCPPPTPPLPLCSCPYSSPCPVSLCPTPLHSHKCGRVSASLPDIPQLLLQRGGGYG